jgi:hypothetical protein
MAFRLLYLIFCQRTKPCLQPTVIAFDPAIGVSVVRCQAAGSGSSSTTG